MNRKIALALIIIVAVSSVSMIGYMPKALGQSGTNVSGIISASTTWTQANSPYTFTGPVAVDAGATLTIQPGVIISLDSNYLQVNGTLTAVGTKTNPIQFEIGKVFNNIGFVEFTQSSIGWNKQAGTGCIIENAVLTEIIIDNASPEISHDSFNSVAINGGSPTIVNNNLKTVYGPLDDAVEINGGSPLIASNNIIVSASLEGGISIEINSQPIGSPLILNNTICYDKIDNEQFEGNSGISEIAQLTLFTVPNYSNTTIFDNSISGWTFGIEVGDNSTIEGNLIFNNTEAGITVGATCNCTIESNTITDNPQGIGIYASNSISGYPTSIPTIVNNNVYGNQFNIYLNSVATNINAVYNWWGTTNTQAINQTIWDNKNDFNLGTVTFVPFLTEPNPQAPSMNAALSTPTQSSTLSPTPTTKSTLTSPNSTVTPQNPTTGVQTKTGAGVNWTQIALFAALAVIATLVMVVVVLARRKVVPKLTVEIGEVALSVLHLFST